MATVMYNNKQVDIMPVGLNLETKNITSNGSYTPSTGYSGFSSVNVNVPSLIPTGTETFTQNGTFDVTNIASAIINVAAASGIVINDIDNDKVRIGTFTLDEEPNDSQYFPTTVYFNPSYPGTTEPKIVVVFPTGTIPYEKNKPFLWGGLYYSLQDIHTGCNLNFYVRGGSSNNRDARKPMCALDTVCVYSTPTSISIYNLEYGGTVYKLLPNVQYMYIAIS